MLNGYWQGTDYRFGYQGSEKENEIHNGGYSTEYRILDVRIGRWFSPDPITHPWQSPYCSMDNNPVALNDVLGLSAKGNDDKKGKKIKSLFGDEKDAGEYHSRGGVRRFLKKSAKVITRIAKTVYAISKRIEGPLTDDDIVNSLNAITSNKKNHDQMQKMWDDSERKGYQGQAPTIEWCAHIIRNSTGSYKLGGAKPGTTDNSGPGSVNLKPDQIIIGAVHTHRYPEGHLGVGPSSGDIWSLMDQPTGFTVMVEAQSVRYALVVTDPDLVKNFLLKYRDKETLKEYFLEGVFNVNAKLGFVEANLETLIEFIGNENGISLYQTESVAPNDISNKDLLYEKKKKWKKVDIKKPSNVKKYRDAKLYRINHKKKH